MNIESAESYYNSVYSEFELTWGKYFHYGVFTRETKDLEAAQEETLRIVAREAGLTADTNVLDLGCGIGSSCFFFAQEYGASCLGIDPSLHQLAYAENERIRRAAVGVEFCRGEAEAIPCASESVDLVIANEVLCYVGDKVGALREIERVLAPHGLCILTDLYEQCADNSTASFHAELRHALPMLSLENYQDVLNSTSLVQLKRADLSAHLARNYEAATLRAAERHGELERILGRERYLATMDFYRLARSVTAAAKIGWFMSIHRKEP